MDINDLRGISTLFCMVGFFAVVYWAYGPSRKTYFEQAGKLVFDETPSEKKRDELDAKQLSGEPDRRER